jgi:hypothetical protein
MIPEQFIFQIFKMMKMIYLDDLIHELSHGIEEQYGYQIYGDQKLKDEFLNKRMHLYKILWEMGFKAPKSFFQDTEYDQEFDEFLHKQLDMIP